MAAKGGVVLERALAQFIEQMGVFFEREGLSRTAGRLMGLLLVKPNPLSLDQMADLLQLSKASISTNIRLLESFGLAERVSLPGDRRDHYRLASDPWGRVTALSVERARDMTRLAEQGLGAIKSNNTEARRRLEELRNFYTLMTEQIVGLLERWRETREQQR